MLNNIRQQGTNYWNVLKWLLSGYYQAEKVAFWQVQILMGLTVATGLAWLLGVVVGLNYLNDSSSLLDFQVGFLTGFFSLPMWVWVGILSLCGLLSALCQYVSFTVGVNSVIRYQKKMLTKGLSVLSVNNTAWGLGLQGSPKAHLNRVLKMGVQMSGLVVRRLVRMLIPLITLIVSVAALFQLNAMLLALMLPLLLLYIVALYFINRRASRNQVQLVGMSKSVMPKLGKTIDEVLISESQTENDLSKKVEESGFEKFSFFKYKRRLAEIHVSWLNSIFLVLGCALIIFVEGTGSASKGVNWSQLILFIIALRYAGGGLQEMASSTVAFSRFLPETELVHQLLNAAPLKATKPVGLIYALNLPAISEGFFYKIINQKFNIHRWEELEGNDCKMFMERRQKVTGTCVVGKFAVNFKQAVRKRKKHIERVLVLDNEGVLNSYEPEIFLNSFDPNVANKVRVKSSGYGNIEDDI